MKVNLNEHVNLLRKLRKIASSEFGSYSDFEYDLREAKDRLKCFLPAIDSKNLRLDGIILKNVVVKLLDVLEENPSWKARRQIVNELLEDDEKISKVVQLLLEGKISEISGFIKITPEDADAICFLFREALLPYLSIIGQRLYEMLKDWDKGFCPVCGMNPGIGIIQKDGTMKLYCSFCSQSWSFPRLKCPFCGNVIHERLGYLQVEGDIAHRIRYCEVCKGYIKTVDSRELEKEVDPEEEYLKTLHLDLLAQEQGFTVKIRS